MTDDVQAGWDDVVRRARRRSPRRLALAAALAVAALGGAPALAVLLTRAAPPKLPAAADRSNVAVVLQPQTGRILVEVAPWKGRDGICYLVLQKRAGCLRRHGQTIAMWPPPVVFTFDSRVVAADHGRVYRFPKLGVAIALPPAGVRRVSLLDRARKPVLLVRLSG